MAHTKPLRHRFDAGAQLRLADESGIDAAEIGKAAHWLRQRSDRRGLLELCVRMQIVEQRLEAEGSNVVVPFPDCELLTKLRVGHAKARQQLDEAISNREKIRDKSPSMLAPLITDSIESLKLVRSMVDALYLSKAGETHHADS